MFNVQKRGALIVFEGLDRSGKSTQSMLLVDSLKKMGKKAERMAFPDRTTPIGKIIGEYLSNKRYKLDDHALHLLFTANRFENTAKIRELIYGGTSVIVDRYSYSGIVFSAAKYGMDINWCKAPENGLPAPDIVFFLDLPFEVMKKRPGWGAERYENMDVQSRVLKEYRNLVLEHKFTVINADDTKERIQRVLLEKSCDVISSSLPHDLGKLHFPGKKKSFESDLSVL